MGPLDLADIEELKVKQGQQRDKVENAPKDKAIKATDKAHKAGNITDREHIENLKNAPTLMESIINNIYKVKDFAVDSVEDAKEFQPWWDVGGNIGALGVRAIDATIPRTPQELQAELVELKAAGAAYPALKLAKEIPIVKKGLGKLDEATIAFRTNLYNNIHASIFNPDGTIVKKGNQPLRSESFESSSPEPNWGRIGTPPHPGEKVMWLDNLADEVLLDATGKHIAQRKEAGYKFLGKFRAEWNKWSKDTGFIQELADKPSTAYVEHLVGKDKYYDRFWALPNEVRFRKGSRHSPNNVRILYNNRMKSFKDASESILKKLHKPKDPMDFILLDYDIPVPQGMSITVKQSPGNLLVKRVDGTVIGELGDYHDILYASDNLKVMGKYKTLSYKLGTNINPRTGKPYIDLTQPRDVIKQQVTSWREKILKDKLQLIIDEEKTLKGMDEATKFQYQGSAIQEDMVEFLDEYHFIKPTEGFRRTMKKDPINSPRGGKPIKTEKDKLEGVFLNKTQERRILKGKLKQRLTKKDIDDIKKSSD